MEMQLKGFDVTDDGRMKVLYGPHGNEEPGSITVRLMPERNVGLNPAEKLLLAHLIAKSVNTDFRGTVWHEQVQKFPTVPLELMVLDANHHVLLAYRDDHEFKGWHHPGSVWNDWETIPERRAKLVAGEIVKDCGIQISEPVPIGWCGVYRGPGPDENLTRTACSLLHISHLVGEFNPKEGYGFFPLDAIPEDTLGCHKYMLRRLQQHLIDGKMICD